VNNLRGLLGSIGWPHNNDASTDIYQMGHIGYYLDQVGLDDYLDWPTHHIGGAPWDGLKNDAIGYLCDRQQPAILGIGNSSHYPLATHYYRNPEGSQWFYMNMGWGTTATQAVNKQWDWPAVFFVGSLVPRNNGVPTPPLKSGGIENRVGDIRRQRDRRA
jgi:hypothetical protein